MGNMMMIALAGTLLLLLLQALLMGAAAGNTQHMIRCKSISKQTPDASCTQLTTLRQL
jgi:hypothetical protein